MVLVITYSPEDKADYELKCYLAGQNRDAAQLRYDLACDAVARSRDHLQVRGGTFEIHRGLLTTATTCAGQLEAADRDLKRAELEAYCSRNGLPIPPPSPMELKKSSSGSVTLEDEAMPGER